MKNLPVYAKALVAAAGAALVVLSESGLFVDSEWLTLAVAVATALGVYGVPNRQPQ